MSQDLYDELRIVRERLDEQDRLIGSLVQDDGGGGGSLDVIRRIRFPISGIAGGATASVDWLTSDGWKTGDDQMGVYFRASSALTVGNGLDSHTGAQKEGYAGYVSQTALWEVIQELCP